MKEKDIIFERIFIRIRKDKFYFLKFILEGYDGLAILSSSNLRKEIVVLRYPRENRMQVMKLVASMAHVLSPYSSANH